MGGRDSRRRVGTSTTPRRSTTSTTTICPMLAAWHASLEVGHPIANKEFLLGAFSRLGEHRREALRIAAGFRGDDAFDSGRQRGAGARDGAAVVSDERLIELAAEAVEAVLLGPPRLRQLAALLALLLAGLRRRSGCGARGPHPRRSSALPTATPCASSGSGRVRLIGSTPRRFSAELAAMAGRPPPSSKRVLPRAGACATGLGSSARPLTAPARLRLLETDASSICCCRGGLRPALTIPPNVTTPTGSWPPRGVRESAKRGLCWPAMTASLPAEVQHVFDRFITTE